MHSLMKRRSLFFLGLLIVLALAVGACAAPAAPADTGAGGEEAAAPAEGGEEAAAPAEEGDRTLNILYWQASSIPNPYLSGGTKDIDAAALVIEPLAVYDDEGNLVPRLAAEIPTLENGGISEDLTTITWKLRDDVVWSDGTPFTADDVVFTWQYCTDPEMGCAQADRFNNVASVEAVDANTVLITFDVAKPYPYDAFTGNVNPILQKAQFQDCMGAAAQTCSEQNLGPIGTGPFKIDEFRVNDVVLYSKNENYRDADNVYFEKVIFKGGGDAASAARAVLETGEADYAWNLQIEPQILDEMAAAGKGTVVTAFSTNVERILINFTNSKPEAGELRSVYMGGENPHPFLTDKAVRQALSMAIDRNVIAEQLYGAGGKATCNILPGPPKYASPNNDDCLVQDIEGANALLDEAGIVDTDGDGIREKDGVPLEILYQTSTNSVRQKTQALIKQWWSEIGVDTELRNIDASVFFGGDPNSPDTYQKFFSDVEMYTNGSSGLDPQLYMSNWQCDQIPTPDTGWQGNNMPRWCSEEYDATFQELTVTAGEDARAALAIKLNDLLVQNYVMLPLVYRGSVSAYANNLEGVRMNAWDSEMWNVGEWSRK